MQPMNVFRDRPRVSLFAASQLVPRLVPAALAALLLVFPKLSTASDRAVELVAVDPSDSNIVYAASNQGIFKSVDAGQSWTELTVGLPPHPSVWELAHSWDPTLDVRTLALDPNDPMTVYAGILHTGVDLRDGTVFQVGGGMFKSTDGGEQWATFGGQGGRFEPLDLAVDPGDPNTVYAAAILRKFGIDLFIKTTTGGKDWLTRLLIPPIETIFLDVGDSNALYAGARGTKTFPHAVFKSVNGGDEWFEIPFPGGRSNVAPRLAADPSRPGTLYGTIDSGIYRSTDSGQSWSWLNGAAATCIAVDVNNPSTLYACGPVGGVARSTDGGETWSLQREGLGRAIVTSLAVDPNDSSTLYVGALSYGTGAIFKSTDGGDNWFDVGPP